MTVSRGDVWWATLDPTVGSEQSGTRPVLIYQADALNSLTRTVITIPLTTNLDRSALPTGVLVEKSDSGLRQDSVVLCHQLRVLALARLKSRIGTLSSGDLAKVDAAVLFTLGIPGLGAGG